MCSFAYPKPTLDGREVCAESFEWIRQRIWKMYHWHLKANTLWSPPEWDEAYVQSYDGEYYGYVRGDLVVWNGEYYLCDTIVNAAYVDGEWVAENPQPDEGGWVLGVNEEIYCHYAYNSGRYKASVTTGPPEEREILLSYYWLPEHVVRWNRVQGPLQWTPYTLFWEEDTIQIGSNYYACTLTHKSGAEFSATNWSSITAAQAGKPIYHPQPVEVKKDHISKELGAKFSWPYYAGGDPTPLYYNYHMNVNMPSNSTSEYTNLKMNPAYQDAVELAVNSTAWLFSGEMHADPDAPVHRAGYGVDPSGSYFDNTGWNKNNWAFNKSGFEECLYKINSFDWYLDTEYAPAQSDYAPNNSLACWRRTWKYSMVRPGGTMWPGEKGNPPEPATDWKDADAIEDMIAYVEATLTAEEVETLEKRHTCEFFSEYAEIPAQIVIDMIAVLDLLQYKEIWPTMTQGILSRSVVNSTYQSSFSAAMSELESLIESAEWVEYYSDPILAAAGNMTKLWVDSETVQFAGGINEAHCLFDISDEKTKQLLIDGNTLVLPLEIFGGLYNSGVYPTPESWLAVYNNSTQAAAIGDFEDTLGSEVSGNAWTNIHKEMVRIFGMETVERESVEYTRFKLFDENPCWHELSAPPSSTYPTATTSLIGVNSLTCRYLSSYPIGIDVGWDDLALGCYAFPATKVIPTSSGLTLP